MKTNNQVMPHIGNIGPQNPPIKELSDFNRLYRRYHTLVARKCYSMLQNECLAKDATQEIFIKVFTQLSKFRNEAKLSSWLYRISHNYCVDFLRRRKPQHTLYPLSLGPAYELPIDQSPPEVEPIDRRMAAFDRIMARLPEADQQLLYLKYQENLSVKTIARIKHLSEGAVKMRILRAKEKAKRLRNEA